MAIIPTANFGIQQGISRAQGEPVQQVRTSTQDFGGQEAQDLQRFGNAVTGVAIKQLDQTNKTLVTDAGNMYRTEARALNLKYRSLKGKEAIGSAVKLQEDLTALRSKVAEGLSSPAQQRAFNADADGVDFTTTGQIQLHQAQQEEALSDATYKASLYNFTQDAKVDINSPGGIINANVQLKEIEAAVVERNASKVSEETLSVMVTQAKQNFHVEMLKTLDETNPAKGMAYLEEFKDEIDPAVYEKMKKAVTEEAKKQLVEQKADFAQNAGLSPSERNRYIQDIEDVDVRAGVRREMAIRDAEDKRVKTLAFTEKYNANFEAIRENPNAPVSKGIPPDMQQSLLNFQKSLRSGAKKPEDMRAYFSLRTEIQTLGRMPRGTESEKKAFAEASTGMMTKLAEAQTVMGSKNINDLQSIFVPIWDEATGSKTTVSPTNFFVKEGRSRLDDYLKSRFDEDSELVGDLTEEQTNITQAAYITDFYNAVGALDDKDLTPEKVDSIVTDLITTTRELEPGYIFSGTAVTPTEARVLRDVFDREVSEDVIEERTSSVRTLAKKAFAASNAGVEVNTDNMRAEPKYGIVHDPDNPGLGIWNLSGRQLNFNERKNLHNRMAKDRQFERIKRDREAKDPGFFETFWEERVLNF